MPEFELSYKNKIKQIAEKDEIKYFLIDEKLNISINDGVQEDLNWNIIQHPNEQYTTKVVNLLASYLK